MQRSILSLAFLLFGVCPSLSGQSNPHLQGEASLHPGDVLRIVVWQEPELSGDLPVNAEGKLQHPLYEDLQVTGVPLSQVQENLRTFLTRYRDSPQFSIEPLIPVVITGEVTEGGVLTLSAGVTLARAMTLAGPTKNARYDRARLIRDRQTYTIDFNDPEADWARATVRSGDHIIVQPRLNILRDVVGPVTGMMGAVTSMITFMLFMVGQF